MKKDLDTVLALLPQLADDELSQVQMALHSLGQFQPLEEQRADDAKMYIDCICSVLTSMGVERCTPKLLKGVESFNEKADNVSKWLANSNLKREERRAVVMKGVELLYKNMQELGVPTSGRMVAQHFHRLPSVVNNAFPGYAIGGVLGMLVRRKVHNYD